jgi:hypothetical protein
MATRTLTEFSGSQIRMAAKAEAEASKTLPPEVKAIAPSPAPAADAPEVTAQPTPSMPGAAEIPHMEPEVDGGPGEISEAGAFSSATDAADEVTAVEKAAGDDAKAAEAAQPVALEPPLTETDAVKAILDKAVAEATGTSGERLDRLREALKAVGRGAERVRLVRVFSNDPIVQGARLVGEHQYVVDLLPHSMKQTFADPKEERGAKRGPRRPSGSTKNKDGSTLEGSFSMESLAQDRRNERGGPGARRPGDRAGGRGGPGGGRPGGGRPGSGRPGAGRPGAGPRGKPAPKP